MCADSPEGRLMRFPSLSLRRERLNLPFLFFTLGLSLLSWKMRMLSSLSSTLISRSASCCSRRFNSSSWDFCWRAARVSSSSLEHNSWRKRKLTHIGGQIGRSSDRQMFLLGALTHWQIFAGGWCESVCHVWNYFVWFSAPVKLVSGYSW